MTLRPHKPASIFFVLLLLVISLRFVLFTCYLNHQKPIFRSALLRSSAGQIISFTLPDKNLYANSTGIEWKDNNREIVISGVYYEVLALNIADGKAHLSLLEDKEESRLFKQFLSLDEPHSGLSELIDLLLKVNFHAGNSIICLPKSSNFFTTLLPHSPECLKGHMAGPDKPPQT